MISLKSLAVAVDAERFSIKSRIFASGSIILKTYRTNDIAVAGVMNPSRIWARQYINTNIMPMKSTTSKLNVVNP